MNHSDSERIATVLENHKFKPAKNISEASLVVFNTCGVRQMAENRVYGQIHNLKTKNYKLKPKIILTGCLANRKDVQRRLRDKVDLFVDINSFPKKIKEILQSEICNYKFNKLSDYLSIRPKYNSKFEAFVPVMTGCNNFCSYCVVPYARGREISRPAEEVIFEIKDLVKKGYKLITLLGQNVNSYQDEKINFAKLLKKVNALPGHFWITFFTSHPKDMSDELIEAIAQSKKVCEFVHLPIQAGEDKILKAMNRKYTAKHYLELVGKIKRAFRKYKTAELSGIAGDIIVGFPGETRKQFLQSAEVMKKVQYDMVYFGQFSPRPETAAWKMRDNVSNSEKDRREKYLNEILKKTSFANNKKYLGKKLEILIREEKNGHYFGITRTMKNIKLEVTKKNLVGKFAKIEITKANIWNLEARLESRKRSSARGGENYEK